MVLSEFSQQQDKGGGGGGCMACLAGACLCCCAEGECLGFTRVVRRLCAKHDVRMQRFAATVSSNRLDVHLLFHIICQMPFFRFPFLFFTPIMLLFTDYEDASTTHLYSTQESLALDIRSRIVMPVFLYMSFCFCKRRACMRSRCATS